MLLVILSQSPAEWPTYGSDLANTHFSPLKGAMSSAPSVTWQYSGVGYVERSPATAEIGDGDAELETLIPGYSSGTMALVEGGTQTVQWTWGSGGNPICTAAMYDVDADPQLECIVTYSYSVGTVCLDGLSGTPQWTFSPGNTWGSAKVADFVPSNPGLEVIVGSSSGLYCLDAATGTQLWLSSVGTVNTTPAAADVDGDGNLEIAVASNTTLAVLEGENGSVKWSVSLSNNYPSPTLIDATGDGSVDVIAGSSGGTVYCYDASTGSLHWSNSLLYGMQGGTAAWDIDGDGDIEVIAGCNNSSNTSGALYCIDGPTGNVDWTYSTPYGVHRAVSLVDVNSDNLVEILLPGCRNGNPNTLKCLSPSGTLLWEVSLSTAHDIHDPSNADYDNDGCAELIVGTYGVNSAWFLDDPGDSSGCGTLYDETEEEPGPGTGELRIRLRGRVLLLTVPRGMPGEIALYDVPGRRVKTLFSGQLTKGQHEFALPRLTPGVYTAVLRAGGRVVSVLVPEAR